jgi:predicted nucleotidyltransferase
MLKTKIYNKIKLVFVMVEKMIFNNLKAYFDHKDNICIVYLFGSVVKGKNRKNSDVDVGILFSEDMDIIERFGLKLEIACELEDLLGTKVDIVDLNSAVPYFIHQVLLNKLVIFEANIHRRVEFEVKSRREYFDMLPFYKLYHSQAMERLEGRCANGRTKYPC